MIFDQFRKNLLSDEKILWQGAPAQGLVFTRQDWFLIPFSAMWGGFAFFWEAATQAPLLMRLWGIPFVLVGLYLIVGRFVLDASVRRGTQYAVTNRRILIFLSGPFAKLTTISLNQLPETSLIGEANGRGTIRFGQTVSGWNNSFSSWTPSLDPTPQFFAIENAGAVYNMIQRETVRDS